MAEKTAEMTIEEGIAAYKEWLKDASVTPPYEILTALLEGAEACLLLWDALKELDDFYQASGKVWDRARAALKAAEIK